MRIKRARVSPLHKLLSDARLRRWVMEDGLEVFAAQDVVAILAETAHPDELWKDLKAREPYLAQRAIELEVEGRETAPDGGEDLSAEPVSIDVLDREGVLRLIQSIPSVRAERLKNWLARSARQRMEEADDPELAIVRTRRALARRGYPKSWVDKRLRGVSARHDMTGHWYRRGVRDGEQFRALTNELMRGAFGMDVEAYRKLKGLTGTRENLRDHMNDVELALTTLAETLAVSLDQDQQSQGFESLLAGARSAGDIVAITRNEIERRTGRPVVSPRRDALPDQGPGQDRAASPAQKTSDHPPARRAGRKTAAA